MTFKKEFRIPNFATMRNGVKTYLRLDRDNIYQEFMIMVFQFLSPVQYEAGKILYMELDDINNIQFIT